MALNVHEHAAQPLLDAQRLEQSLLFGHRKLNVPSNEVGELAGLGDGIENLVYNLLWEAALLAEFGGALANLLVEGLEGAVVLVERIHVFHLHRDRG